METGLMSIKWLPLMTTKHNIIACVALNGDFYMVLIILLT